MACSLLLCFTLQVTAQDAKLVGTVIGSSPSVNYGTGQQTTTVNTCEDAFDGRLDTFFASWERNYTWAGLDLGQPCVITRVGWSPRNDSYGPGRVRLGVFEGANREDFMDALPLYIITQNGTIGKMSYADVNCSRGFRYVRYIGPADARCNVAELEFYGHEGAGDDSRLYQLTNLPTVSKIIRFMDASAAFRSIPSFRTAYPNSSSSCRISSSFPSVTFSAWTAVQL